MDKKDDIKIARRGVHGRFWRYIIWAVIIWLFLAYFLREKPEVAEKVIPGEAAQLERAEDTQSAE
ncbi:MAG: hypothetical protein GF409_07745 [Candidatus Omnitrophica bacterium]|nr:hypothetical protein [Candidatus Omnitrophota bacterium]